MRLYDIQDGSILIDGQDIRETSMDSLRSRIGVVTQDTGLLHRSVRDNIMCGKPDATQAELECALDQSRVAQFLPDLQDEDGGTGLDSSAGERGARLSGGQRQRIILARTLLKNAPILVLDEATAALESEAEHAIQEQLDTLMVGKTVITIAHRLSTLARMDRIVVLDSGRISRKARTNSLSFKGAFTRLSGNTRPAAASPAANILLSLRPNLPDASLPERSNG